MSNFYSVNSPLSDVGLSLKGRRERGSLQAFQAHISQRITQAQLEEQQTHALLSVQLKQYHLLISLLEINELITPNVLTPVPLAKRWVLGLTVARAEVISVFDLNYCLTALLTYTPDNWRITPDTPFKPKINEKKWVLLSSTVAQRLAFVAEKVNTTVTPQLAGYTPLPWNNKPVSNFLASSVKDSVILNDTNYSSPQICPDFVLAAWQDTQKNAYLEISLTKMLQSNAFNSLIY